MAINSGIEIEKMKLYFGLNLHNIYSLRTKENQEYLKSDLIRLGFLEHPVSNETKGQENLPKIPSEFYSLVTAEKVDLSRIKSLKMYMSNDFYGSIKLHDPILRFLSQNGDQLELWDLKYKVKNGTPFNSMEKVLIQLRNTNLYEFIGCVSSIVEQNPEHSNKLNLDVLKSDKRIRSFMDVYQP
jgi:hypothetical protein